VSITFALGLLPGTIAGMAEAVFPNVSISLPNIALPTS
jgi:hypothetical protein